MSAIDDAADAIRGHLADMKLAALNEDDVLTMADIIKRKLEKAVPAKALVVYEGRDSRTVGEITGHNECRKLMGLE